LMDCPQHLFRVEYIMQPRPYFLWLHAPSGLIGAPDKFFQF
jgi:hypothetical protein